MNIETQMYVRTPDTIFTQEVYETLLIEGFYHKVLRKSSNLLDLIDAFLYVSDNDDGDFDVMPAPMKIIPNYTCYGVILTSSGLTKVAKFTEEGVKLC